MRTRHFLVLAAVTLFVAFGPAERTTPTKWALVVGISDYMNFGDEIGGDLPGAANDARAMANVMVNKYGFDPDNVKLILDHDATRDRLVTELSGWLPSVTRPGDLVTIYFAGHGSQTWNVDGTEEDGLDETFCPADVMRGNTEMDIRDKEMAGWLAQMNTDNIVVIWDKCHARGSTRDVTPFARPRSLARSVDSDVPRPEARQPAAAAPGDAGPQPGVLEIAAAQADEVALDLAFPNRSGTGHTFGGAFTTPFVQNLWNAPPGASYEDIFAKTIDDMRRDRSRQQPDIEQKPLKDRPLFSNGEPAQGAADGLRGDGVRSGMVRILEAGSDDRVVLSGGANADITARSLYGAGGDILEVVDVGPDRAFARVSKAEARTGAPDPAATPADGSAARLLAYRYPEARLRVMVTDLESDERSALRAELGSVPLVLIDDGTSFAHLLVRPRGDHYVVLNLDGFPRDSVAAGPGATADLARLLEREYGQYQLAELENPARPFQVEFAFGHGRNDLVLGETLSFHVTSEREGYLTIVDLAPDGTVTVIFPNEYVEENRVLAGQPTQFPAADSDIAFAAIEPLGRGIVRAFVTERPLVLPFTQSANATEADRIWTALRNAAGQAPVRGSEAIPVENWATSAIVYDIRRP